VNVRNVVVENENEVALINQLIGSYQVAFSAADLVDIAVVSKDPLITNLRRAELAVAGLNIALARRYLCKGVALSKRRGELIALAGHLADLGSRVEPKGAPATWVWGGEPCECGQDHICPRCSGYLADVGASVECTACEWTPDSECEGPDDISALPACPDCGNVFPSQDELDTHQLVGGGCPVAQIRDLEAEQQQLALDADAEPQYAECGTDVTY
jgi:hypothetical protein